LKKQNDFLFDNEDENSTPSDQNGDETTEDNNENGDKDIPINEFFPFHSNMTKEEMEARGFKVKTIRFTPFDLLIMLVCMFLFTLAGCGLSLVSFLALIISAPLYATFSYRISNNFSFFVPLAAIVACGFITKSPIMPLGVLLATGMSYIMLYSVNNKPESAKTSAVVGCCVSMGIYLLAAYFIGDLMNKISEREIMSAINSLFENMEAQALGIYTEMAKSGIDLGLSDAELENAAKLFAQSSRSLLPSVIIICFMIISYISASLLPLFSKLLRAKEMLGNICYEIKLSKIAVVVYLISWFGSLFGTGIFSVAFRNIISILAPALSLCGIKQIGEFLHSKGTPKIISAFVQLISIFAAFVLGDIGLSVLMMFGVFHTLKTSTPNNM